MQSLFSVVFVSKVTSLGLTESEKATIVHSFSFRLRIRRFGGNERKCSNGPSRIIVPVAIVIPVQC